MHWPLNLVQSTLLPVGSTGRRQFALYSSPLTGPSSPCAPVFVGWSPAWRASRRLGRRRNRKGRAKSGREPEGE
ncbi:hypothetical protein Dimus_011346 [Dionaea muscipula]